MEAEKVSIPQIELRSPEMDDVIEAQPAWIARIGIFLIGGFLCVILFVSWFVRYPDVIEAKMLLRADPVASRLIAKREGVLQILIKDGDLVVDGTPVILIGTQVLYADYLTLVEWIADFAAAVDRPKSLIEATPPQQLQIGNLQKPLSDLEQALLDYKLFSAVESFEKERDALKNSIEKTKLLAANEKRQSDLSGEITNRALEGLRAIEGSYQKAAISRADLHRSQNELAQGRQGMLEKEKQILALETEISRLEASLATLERTHEISNAQKHSSVTAALNMLLASIYDWEDSYFLKSPVTGEVSFSKVLENGDFINAGEEILAVVPQSRKYSGFLEVAQSGAGKIARGMKVNIDMDTFPAKEFGILEGKIVAISPVPHKDNFLLSVGLSNGSISSFKKNIALKDGMTGVAKIITKDRNLFQRMFESLFKVFRS